MKSAELDYKLPPGLIAQRPLERRDESRLLVFDRGTGEVEHRRFGELPELLPRETLTVVNDTRVLPARLRLERPGGGEAEVLLLERLRAAVSEQLPGLVAGDPELRRALVMAALACVGDEAGTLRCAPVISDIARRAAPTAIRVEVEPGIATGVVIELATGTRIDATVTTLLDRLWPTLACEALRQERAR